MANTNSTINITVVSSNNKLVVGANVVISVAGKLFNLVTDKTGGVVASLYLSNITIATVKISASNYLTSNITYTVSPNNNNIYTVILSLDPANINQSVKILDTYNNPIADVTLAINGKIIGKTDSSGNIIISAPAGQVTIQANSSLYLPLYLSGEYNQQTFPTQLIIIPKVITGNILTLQGLAFTAISITGSGLTDSLTLDSTGLGNTNIAVPVGSYSITLTNPGYETLTTTLNVLVGVTNYSLPSLQSVSGFTPSLSVTPSVSSLGSQSNDLSQGRLGVKFGVSNSSSSATPGAIASPFNSSINTGGSSESEYPSEWIYPNTGEGRYFTGTQARIYVGNLFIDEIDTIYSVYNNNRIPVYGYSSTNVDAFGKGRRIVQGQLTLNFVSEGYLYTVLSEFQKKNSSNDQSPQEKQTANSIANLATLYQQKKSLASQGPSIANADQIAAINTQIAAAHANLGSDSIAAVKQVLANATTASRSQNAIQLDIPFDIVLNATAGGRTTTRKLKNCLLTTNEQVWDQSDNVIKDVYGFVGVEMI